MPKVNFNTAVFPRQKGFLLRAASPKENPERHCAPSRFLAGTQERNNFPVWSLPSLSLAPRSEVYLNLIWPDLVGLCLRIFYQAGRGCSSISCLTPGFSPVSH